MQSKIKVAVIGSTGAVGQVFLWMLKDHPWFEVSYLTASSSRIGKRYKETVHWVLPFEMPDYLSDYTIQELDMEEMKNSGVKIVFSALPANVANEAEPQLRSYGFYVFSNAASMRYDEDVPILIPEANIEKLSYIEDQGFPKTGFVVTNANCATTGLAMALAPLKKFGIKEINVSTYQSVSGAGYPGLSAFDITNNTIPYIGGEEEKMEKEIQKILDVKPEFYAYCVRVPIMFGHLETVWVTFENDISQEMIIDAWDNFHESVELPSTPKSSISYSSDKESPQHKFAFWGDPRGMVVYTGRLKKQGNKIGFALLVNNIVKGAAGGSIQNAEAFVTRYGSLI
ncbi:MAG: aspartate-semialdehyde dehydrogenase [Sphaerochaetaceae bacterium]|nr:aspartate-semialdehyde dehydrogenase [Sphaerochaetaceae bacterium]